MRRPRALRMQELEDRFAPKTLSLSVLIPVEEEADGDYAQLEACLAPLASAARRGVEIELILATRHANERLVSIAEPFNGKIVELDEGRGARLREAAREATGEWVLILRQNSVLQRGWDSTLMVFASQERNRERGAVYRYKAPGESAADRFAQRSMRFRNRWLISVAGVQGLVIRRRFLAHLGSVPALSRCEDMMLARELGMGRLAIFDTEIEVHRSPTEDRWSYRLLSALRLVLFTFRVPAKWLQHLPIDK